MKVPLSWLGEFVDIPVSVEELAYRLTMAGLEVAEICRVGVEGAPLPWSPQLIVIADILEVRPHPNADRLLLVEANYGGSQSRVVVTGAPNLFPYLGKGPLTPPLKSVLALEQAELFDGHASEPVKMILQARWMRGVLSDAMLCSEKELGMSDEHEGILLLDEDIPAGTPARDVLGEIILDIDLTPNLARCLSIVGVAREVSALLGTPLRIPDPTVQMDGPPIGDRVRITVEEPSLCLRFTAGLVEGVKVGPSPSWMRRRLNYAGMRPINNIVDISNYVMLEWGEPSHAFDADRVKDHHLIIRLARPGERLVTLDGKEHSLAPEHAPHAPPLLVCDPTGPLAIAGVMGGETSEVRATTTRVLLEAAIWEPRQIRRTAQAFKIPSEASRRYERGVDLEIAPLVQRRALELMRTLAHGTVAQGMIDIYPQPWQPLVLDLPTTEVARILGVHLQAHEIARMLASLGFSCQVLGGDQAADTTRPSPHRTYDAAVVRVHVPSYRQDVTTLADLCEEIARIYGYDSIPSTRLPEAIPMPDPHPELELEQRVRDILIGCGLDDVITYSLTSMETIARLNPSQAVPSLYLRVNNAMSPEREYLQRSLLPNLLESLAANLRERERALLFEIGRVFHPREQPAAEAASSEWLPDEPRMLGIVIAGPRDPLSWTIAEASRVLLDYFDMKGILEVLIERLGLAGPMVITPNDGDERFQPGRAAMVWLNDPHMHPGQQHEAVRRHLGVFGEIHPQARERLGIATPRVVAAEINLDQLFALRMEPCYRPISRYPAAVQDLAVVIKDTVPADQVEAAIRRAAGDLLESITLFDVYTGPQVGVGHRSLAYRLSFRAMAQTLRRKDLMEVRENIIDQLEQQFDATIRA